MKKNKQKAKTIEMDVLRYAVSTSINMKKAIPQPLLFWGRAKLMGKPYPSQRDAQKDQKRGEIVVLLSLGLPTKK